MITTKEAIDHLAEQLRNDPGYRHSWHCNIAVSVQDAFADSGVTGQLVYDASQKAAERFLNLLLAVCKPAPTDATGEGEGK